MTAKRKILATLMSLAGMTSVGASSVTMEAQAQEACSPSAEDMHCACEEALRVGTIEALEEYLYRYPQHNSCWYRIRAALRDYSPDRERSRGQFTPPGGPTPTPTYGG